MTPESLALDIHHVVNYTLRNASDYAVHIPGRNQDVALRAAQPDSDNHVSDIAIRVTLQLAIAMSPAIFPGYAIRIGGENHGFTEVHFDGMSAAVQVKGLDKTFIIPKPVGDLPRTLKHGESLTVLADLNALNDEIRKLKGTGRHRVRGVLRDQLNRLHASKWTTMDVK